MDNSVEKFLAGYPPEIQAIGRKLRAMAKSVTPGAQELIYHEAIGYSISESPMERIVYIWPVRNHVTLGFFWGGNLDDPHHLLEGTGKRMRYVKVKTLEDASHPALVTLVKAAWADGPVSIAKLKQRMKRKRRKNPPR